MAQRIGSSQDHLRAALTMGTTRAQHEHASILSHRQGSPHRRREPFCARRQGFVIPSITGQNLGSSHSNAKCKPGSPNTMSQRAQSFQDHLRAVLTMWTTQARHERTPNPSHRQGSPHWRRKRFCARKHRFGAIPNAQASIHYCFLLLSTTFYYSLLLSTTHLLLPTTACY